MKNRTVIISSRDWTFMVIGYNSKFIIQVEWSMSPYNGATCALRSKCQTLRASLVVGSITGKKASQRGVWFLLFLLQWCVNFCLSSQK